MMELLTAASPSRCGGKNRFRVSPIVNFGFSFIHPALGIVTIRNGTLADILLLRNTLYKSNTPRCAGLAAQQFGDTSAGSPETELADLVGSSTILMVTCPHEAGETVVAIIVLYKTDAQPDLRRELERSAYDGNDMVRIGWFAAFEQVIGFDRRPMIVNKEMLGKVLDEARRKHGVILMVRNVVVDATYRDSGILKFISLKIDRILKYVYGCSHVIGDDSSRNTINKNNDCENRCGCREMLKGKTFGYREFDDMNAMVDGASMQDLVWISSCETIFNTAPKKSVLRAVSPISVRSFRNKLRKTKVVAEPK